MKSASSKNVVAICDPKLMSIFKSFSDLIDLHYKVFELQDDLRNDTTLLVDEECFELIRRSRDVSRAKIVKISEDNVLISLLELVGVSRVESLVVGVDPGDTVINYVIFANNVLLGYDSVKKFSELAEVINKIRDLLHPEKVVIKIGVSPARLWESLMPEVLRVAEEGRYTLILVDESSTTDVCPTTYIGKKDLRNPDSRACINIALKEGRLRITY
ncbi:MAG: hypothetical protein QN229_03965 [Desulfurococcaceae archaeon TW002]